MNRRINNQLPNNLIQLQNCIKRDPIGYKQEVFYLEFDDFLLTIRFYRFPFCLVSTTI